MKNHLYSLIFAALLFLPATAFAQNITVKAGATKLLYDQRYYPAIFGEGVAPTIPTVGLNIGWRDYSDSPFASICKHPEIGVAFQVDGLADAMAVDGPGLGNIYSVYGFFDRSFIETEHFSLGYFAGYGISCSFSKLYDPVTNPKNLVFSVPFNSRIKFGVQTKFRFAERYYTGLGFYFNHSSNGAIHFPNRGYNGFELSLLVGMDEKGNDRPVTERREDGFKRGFQFDVQASFGIMANEAYYYYCEENLGGGDNTHHPKYSFNADCLYKYCRTHASGIGFDLFVTPFCDQIAEYDGRGEKYDQLSVGISALHEMCYRDLTLTVGLGRYLHHNDGISRNKKLYQMVHIKYHFPSLADTYIGIALKAHKFMAAESIQLCLGKRF
ncbi:MAG: acyloxyacyl hydrolase [Bacteroidales bacterium]|nr:acyloxyacyl hydrolase [Bacteroidales bacterium]